MTTTHNISAILAFILRYQTRHGCAPSCREIQLEVGFSSVSVVHYHLRQMAQRREIIRHPSIARGIKVTARGRRMAKYRVEAL